MFSIFRVDLPKNRNFGLDLLRFIAIISVLIPHSFMFLPHYIQNLSNYFIDGVLIFFVLSGFLIGRILIKDFSKNFTLKEVKNFWKRRWFRTLPAYYISIIIILILDFILNVQFQKVEVIKCILFLQNFFLRSNYFFPESWSLAIEEWFYLTIPIILLILFKIFKLKIQNNLIIIFLLILFISTLYRINVFFTNDINTIVEWDIKLRGSVIGRLDSILIGVFGAWMYSFHKELFFRFKKQCFLIGVLIFFISLSYLIQSQEFGFINSVLYFFITPLAVLLTIPQIYSLKPINNTFIQSIIIKGSIISYSLYLTNYTIISNKILSPLSIPQPLKFVLFWILSTLFSIMMYNYVEKPFLKFRDKISKA